MNTLKHVVNWVIWSLVALYVLLMTLTHLPVFQQWLAGRAAQAIGQKLGTEVHIGSIDLGFLNRLIVDDVTVKDQEQGDLLRVGRMSVKVDLLPLSEGRIVISSAQLFNAHAVLLRKDSLSKTNFQFVIDSLASKDTTSQTPLNLAINSLIVRRSSVSYDQQDMPETKGIINPKHLNMRDISAHILLKALTDDSLSVNVKRLAMKEQSGLTVSRLSMQLQKDTHGAQLRNFFLQLPRSSLTIDSIVATCDFNHLKETLQFTADLTDASITPSDLSFLTPKTSQLKSPISLNAHFSGSTDNIDVEKLQLFTADGALSAKFNGWYRNSQTKPVWHAQVERLTASSDFFSLLMQNIEGIPQFVSQLNQVRITGEATAHTDGSIDMNGQVASNMGNLKLKANIADNRYYRGHIDTDSIQLGQLLENEQLGLLTATVDISGDQHIVSAQGNVSHLDFRGYTYRDITVDGSYNHSKGDIAGKLQIKDSHLETDLEGSLVNNGNYAIRLTGDVKHLSPKALQLSDQWGNATFSALLDVDFVASNLNDAQGRVNIKDFVMRDTTSAYRISNLQLLSGYDEETHFLKLTGDMGEAELKGHFDWATLPQSFYSYIGSKLPTLPGLPSVSKPIDNDFDIRLFLNDTEWLRHLLSIDLSLQKPLILHASINDKSHKLNVAGSMPKFRYNDSQYENANIRISSPGDSMKCEVGAVRVSDDNGDRMDFNVQATAAHNELVTTLGWDNNKQNENIKGQLHTSTSLYRNTNGKPEAHIYVLPSYVVMGDTTWIVEPGGIVYNAGQLLVDHLSVTNAEQHIIVDGIASDSSSDSLIVDLKGVEVSYILDLVGFTAVSFAGKATGKAFVTQAFGQPNAWANLRVDQFRFEGGRMGTLNAQAQWNQLEKQIDIHAIANDGPDAITYIDGYVSPVKENIDLAIKGRGTYVEFLHTYASSFLSNITGHAYGDLRLVGPLGEMDLLGKLVVNAQATVTALGTTYTLTQDTVDFVHNDILLHDVTARDIYQNTAQLNGGIHHDNLSDLTFDLDIKTDKLLAYSMPSDNGDIFHGTVFASGDVELIGRPGEVIINCNATPLDGTVFTYDAASPEAISDQSFIRWHTRKENNEANILEETAVRSYTASTTTTEDDSPTTDLRINFLVNTTPDATLRILMDAKTSDYITLAGHGVIRATYYNKGAFLMFGTYTVDQGTYGVTIQNIIKKNFTFQPGGTLAFGGAPFDANLNLQAVYTVNGVSLSDLSIGNSFSNNTVRVNCLMNIGGQAGAPQVEFDLDMPTVNSEEKQMIRSVITSEQEMNQQVLYLLGIGRFYTQGNNNANTQQQYGQSQLAMQSFLSGTLSTQINEVLSQVLKSNNWNFGANISTGNEGWHNAEYEGLVSGRMLNNRLLINGQFGYRDNATQATPSFIGDFDIRYLLHPNGNLALKVYNQTNDRYFTRSSLNTQGIGLIMKKDFNGLGELFHLKREKKQ